MIWNWWGVPGTLVLVLAWSAAFVALRTGSSRRMNRQLALVLGLEGLYCVGNFGLLFFVTDAGAATAFARVGAVAMATLPIQYLLFLGVSLRTPLTRPFGSVRATFVLHGATAVATLFVILVPDLFITEVFRPEWAPWNFTYVRLGPRVVQFHGLVSLLGLIVSIDAYRRAPAGSASRSQAGWFIVAFGIRDAFIAAIQVLMPYVRPIPFWGDLIYNPIHGLMYMTYVPLLAYAILRHQLLDIDLRVKFIVKQGSVGAVLAVLFLITSEVIESIVPVEGAVLGVILALVIAAALRPAQRVAERVAAAVMPGVEPSKAYLGGRARLVMRGALENAWADGELSANEQSYLKLLREELDITSGQAAEVEAEVLSQLNLKPAARAF